MLTLFGFLLTLYESVSRDLESCIISEQIIVELQEAQYPQFLLQWTMTHYILRSIFFRTIIVRIPHLRITHWGAILRWGILSQSVIRITHPNHQVFYALFVHDMGPG